MPVLFPRREMQAYYQTISFLAPAAVTENGLWNFPAFTAPNPLGNVWEGGWPKDLGEGNFLAFFFRFPTFITMRSFRPCNLHHPQPA